jgi:hypothetical protein
MSRLQSRERAQVNEGADAFSKLEGEIRQVVRQEATAPRVPQGSDNELADVGSLLQRVSGASVQEIENLIAELQILRDKLQNEAARVQREIVAYALRIQDARKAISIISESLSFWRNDGDSPKIGA